LKVNLLSDPYGIETDDPVFSWIVNDSDQNETQTAYQIMITTSVDKLDHNIGNVIDTGKVFSDNSSDVEISNLKLNRNTLYYWKVRTWDKYGFASGYSVARPMTTSAAWENLNTVWAPNGNFVFLRNEFAVPNVNQIAKAIVSVTATSPNATKQYVYNLYLNGKFIGMGPAQTGNRTIQYNSFDVTDALKTGKNAIGAINYAESGRQFLLQMTVYYKNGSYGILLNSGRDRTKWKCIDGTNIYGSGKSVGTEYYIQAAENIDAGLYPDGWDMPGFDDSHWVTPVDSGKMDTASLVSSTTENENRYTVDPAKIINKGRGDYFIDLGVEIVGGIRLDITSDRAQKILIQYAEEKSGSDAVKYKTCNGNNNQERWKLKIGHQVIQNFGIMSFRYIEIKNCPVTLTQENVNGIAVRQNFDDSASAFTSSDTALNQVYHFVKYSVKATNQNLYVDSQTRERTPYEADTLIESLSSYAFENKYALARASNEYLMYKGTWPVEYKLMSVMISWDNYLYSGDLNSLKRFYTALKKDKLLANLFDSRYDLLGRETSAETQSDSILVDWPSAERDGYNLQDAQYNTVLNAVAYGAYTDMSKIAAALGNRADRIFYAGRAARLKTAMNQRLYDCSRGAFYDGLKADGTPIRHYAQQASVFPLAFGVVDDLKAQNAVVSGSLSSGIKGSPYEAYFYLKALFNANAGNAAVGAMTSHQLKGWEHEINDLGATITTESWDPSIKGIMTFSHPWGTAPASQITSGMFGILPLTPGFGSFQIKFQPGGVKSAQIKTPTVKGTITAAYSTNDSGRFLKSEESVPVNSAALVYIPIQNASEKYLLVDGKRVKAKQAGNYLMVSIGSGKHIVAVP
jgi:alpha-L-rhamnosidase